MLKIGAKSLIKIKNYLNYSNSMNDNINTKVEYSVRLLNLIEIGIAELIKNNGKLILYDELELNAPSKFDTLLTEQIGIQISHIDIKLDKETDLNYDLNLAFIKFDYKYWLGELTKKFNMDNHFHLSLYNFKNKSNIIIHNINTFRDSCDKVYFSNFNQSHLNNISSDFLIEFDKVYSFLSLKSSFLD